MRKRIFKQKIILTFVAIFIILVVFWATSGKTFAPKPTNAKDINKQVSNSDKYVIPGEKSKINNFNKNKYSTTDPSSIWVVVNKKRPLSPSSYAPKDLVIPNIPLRNSNGSSEMLVRSEVAQALQQMATDAKKDSINILLASGYRSYGLQVAVYNNFVKVQGQAVADTQSARPGFSEHQTGMAVDLGSTNRKCEIEDCFANTAEGKWLAANSYKYGFILRYPPESKSIVGYKYEPWHFRYVGTELATEMNKTGQLFMEFFFGLPAAPDY